MGDRRVSKLASILVNYCLEVKRNEKIFVQSQIAGIPLAQEVIKRILQKKAHPIIDLTSPDLERTFYQYSTKFQLQFFPKSEEIKTKNIDKCIDISAETNTRVYSGIDPKKLVVRSKASKKVISEASIETLVCFPTQAYAQDAGMSLEEYENFLYKATNRNWKQLTNKWKRYHSYLKGSEEVRIKGLETDISFDVKRRLFLLENGKTNMPGGEIYTSPEEYSLEGHILFDMPAVYENVEANKIRLRFKNGKVVDASAEQGEEYLIKLLDTDNSSRYIGEFGIGLNYNIKKVTKEILFDEKIGGTIHLALGDGHPECKGKNVSAIHWDLIKDLRKGGEIYIDGELFQKNGRFKI